MSESTKPMTICVERKHFKHVQFSSRPFVCMHPDLVSPLVKSPVTGEAYGGYGADCFEINRGNCPHWEAA